MLPPDASVKALQSFFHKHQIAEISELFHLLQTRSRMSVFRRLKTIGYRSSFNHAGRYYTLADVPRFDPWGLWFYRDVGFSCAGTLKATVLALVEDSATGMTPKELIALLKLPVANTLYNTLHELRQGARIGRQTLAGRHIYLSADPGRADEQLMQRRQAPSSDVQLSNETVIAVLVEALQSAEVWVAPSVLALRLAARGVVVTAVQVERIFTRYGLGPEKKRRTNPRDGCRTQSDDSCARSSVPPADPLYHQYLPISRRGAGPVSCVRGCAMVCPENQTPPRQNLGSRAVRGARDCACLFQGLSAPFRTSGYTRSRIINQTPTALKRGRL